MLTEKVFVDTNVIVALLDKSDIHADKAQLLISRLEDNDKQLLTADCVLNETYTVLARRCRDRGYNFEDIVDAIRRDVESLPALKMYSQLKRLHQDVVRLMVRTQGRLNYHDALISLYLKEAGIQTIATFDNDFHEIEWLQVES